MIVVFGSVNLDLLARVEAHPLPGETVTGSSFTTLPGGKGANQALAARRAGATVAMVGAVGTDAFGVAALAGLAAAGINLSWIRRVEAPTGVALVQVDAAGRNSITVIPGANAQATAAFVPEALLAAGTTLLLQLEVPLPAVCEVAATAADRGAQVMLNAAPARALPDALLASLAALVVNEHEAATIFATRGADADPGALASAVHRRHGCAAIVTLGARGAMVAADGRLWRARAPAVEIVDTTGAGDAFVGALAAARDRGDGWRRALADGVAAGSLACRAVGAQSALPSATAIRELALTVESGIDSRSLE